MLSVKDLNVCYGAIHAIHDVSLEVHDGEIVSLIGANGAGKTTILHTITGLKKAKSGSVTYNDADLLKTDPSKIITLGVAHVPEGRHIFPGMTVEENLEMGAYIRKDDLSASIKEVYERFPRLKERRRQLAGTLSGGEQQKCAIAKVLLSEPRVLLLDEPTKGLDAYSKRNLQTLLSELRRDGLTLLLVTHDVEFAAENADRCALFFDGEVFAAASPGQFFSGNSFYTTVASRMARRIWRGAVTCDDVVSRCLSYDARSAQDGKEV